MTAAHEANSEITVSEARARLAELLDTKVREGQTVYLTRYGHRVGALVPPEVAEHVEALEDAYWSRRAEAVLRNGEPTVPWDEAVALLETGNVDE